MYLYFLGVKNIMSKNIFCKLTFCCLMLHVLSAIECHANISASFTKECDQDEVQKELADNERVIPIEQEESSSDEESSSFDFESDSDTDDDSYAADNDELQFAFDEDVRLQQEKAKLAPRSEVESMLDQLEQLESEPTYLDPE